MVLEYEGERSAAESYCICIEWESLAECFRLSLDNAERLVEDSRVLMTGHREQSARALLVLAHEEIGRAVLAMERHRAKTKVTYWEYQETFQSHRWKIDACKRYFYQNEFDGRYGGLFSGWESQRRLNDTYVDYDFLNMTWLMPFTYRDIQPESVGNPSALAQLVEREGTRIHDLISKSQEAIQTLRDRNPIA